MPVAIFAGILMALVIAMGPLLGAAAAQAQNETGLSQGFTTKETDIPAGSLVSLEQNNTKAVELANQDRVERLVGVVADNPLIELSDDNSQIQAIISGTTSTLVSDINGGISAGDKITASPINGVGMKTTESVQVIGTAQSDFDISKAATRRITDKKGKSQDVHVGLVSVQVNVTYYAAPESTAFLPPFIQNFLNSVAGKDVSPIRALISMLILLLGFVSIGVLLYSSVHSSIISIGRNPLSEKAVNKSLIAVILMSIGMLLVMIIAIYLILTV